MVATRYLDSEIVLDWEDLESVEYDEYPSPKIQEGFNVNLILIQRNYPLVMNMNL